jgi:hypothetical protein
MPSRSGHGLVDAEPGGDVAALRFASGHEVPLPAGSRAVLRRRANEQQGQASMMSKRALNASPARITRRQESSAPAAGVPAACAKSTRTRRSSRRRDRFGKAGGRGRAARVEALGIMPVAISRRRAGRGGRSRRGERVLVVAFMWATAPSSAARDRAAGKVGEDVGGASATCGRNRRRDACLQGETVKPKWRTRHSRPLLRDGREAAAERRIVVAGDRAGGVGRAPWVAARRPAR